MSKRDTFSSNETSDNIPGAELTTTANFSLPNLSSPKLPQPIFLPTLKLGPTKSSRELEEEVVLDPGWTEVPVLMAVLARETRLEAGSWSSLLPPPPPRSRLSPFCILPSVAHLSLAQPTSGSGKAPL